MSAFDRYHKSHTKLLELAFVIIRGTVALLHIFFFVYEYVSKGVTKCVNSMHPNRLTIKPFQNLVQEGQLGANQSLVPLLVTSNANK